MKKTKRDSKNALLTYTVPALMGAALIAAAVWGRSQAARAEEYRLLADEYVGLTASACAQSGCELCDSVREMKTSLEKLRVTASTANRVLALEDIVRESAEAGKLLCRIPGSQVKAMGLASFITRIGDYARSISKRLLSGGSLEERDTEQLSAMLEALRSAAERIEGELPAGTEDFDYYDTDGEPSEPEYPTLIYDGPFSESTEKAEPLGVTGEEGTTEEARTVAERIAGTGLEYVGRTDGRIPTYDFSGGGFEVSITVKGLHVKYMMGTPSSDAGGRPDEGEYQTLVHTGREFLESLGYTDMRPTFAEYRDGSALISFAWSIGDITVYNDLVKVWIDRASGEPIGLDANNYLFSHHERDRAEPAVSEAEARAALSEAFAVTGTGLALIPTSPMSEALCWEFRGSCGDCEYIVYVDALTGAEERIFIIVSDDYGEKAV